MPDTHFGFCNICDAICGLAIEVEGDRVLSIRGDEENRFSRGHVCPKGVAGGQDVHHDPDRIRKPMRRRGGDWEEISWKEALEEAGERLAGIQKRHGNDSLAFYFGNPVSHNHGSLLHLIPFARGLRTKNAYSSGSVDAFPRMLVSQLLYGNPAALPIPDLDRVNYLLVIGANPVVSNGSIMTAPGMKSRLRDLRSRGGKLVVIDPRRSETAMVADEHHFVEPGTDALLLLSFLQVLFEEGLTKFHEMPVPVVGVDGLARIAADYAPEKVASSVGIDPATIRRLARDFANAEGAACYSRMGTSMQAFGTLATWLTDMVNIATGNLDSVGGCMFTTPAVDLVGLANALGQASSFGAYKSRVGGLPELNGELPVAAMYQEMCTPGPGQIRGLISLSANMVLSLPNGRLLDRLLANLDYMVSVDFYLNETSRHAHLILPPVTSLQSAHYPILEHAMAVRNTAHYAPAAISKSPGEREDWEIMVALAESIGRHRGGIQRATGILHGLLGRLVRPDRLLDLLLRVGPHKLSLKKLRENPHGLDLGPLEPRLARILGTPGKTIDLLPRVIVDDLPRLAASLHAPPRRPNELKLVSMRTLRSMNAWLHNSPRLTSGKARCVLAIHPLDAARIGVVSGGFAKLSSGTGWISVLVSVTDDVKPGVACLPFGWGHDRAGSRLSVAARVSGASYNDLVDETITDAVSGAAVLNGQVVTVEPAAEGVMA